MTTNVRYRKVIEKKSGRVVGFIASTIVPEEGVFRLTHSRLHPDDAYDAPRGKHIAWQRLHTNTDCVSFAVRDVVEQTAILSFIVSMGLGRSLTAGILDTILDSNINDLGQDNFEQLTYDYFLANFDSATTRINSKLFSDYE
jgi:hypothetical protein